MEEDRGQGRMEEDRGQGEDGGGQGTGERYHGLSVVDMVEVQGGGTVGRTQLWQGQPGVGGQICALVPCLCRGHPSYTWFKADNGLNSSKLKEGGG